MTEFSNKKEMSARFNKGEVTGLSISNGSYGPTFTLSAGEDSVIMRFANDEDGIDFINMVIDAALRIDFSREYDSGYAYAHSSNGITLADVKIWRDSHNIVAINKELGTDA